MNFCTFASPGENRMLLKMLPSKTNLAIFPVVLTIFDVYDVMVMVTWKCLVFILVDMDRENQDVYICTKYKTIRPLL